MGFPLHVTVGPFLDVSWSFLIALRDDFYRSLFYPNFPFAQSKLRPFILHRIWRVGRNCVRLKSLASMIVCRSLPCIRCRVALPEAVVVFVMFVLCILLFFFGGEPLLQAGAVCAVQFYRCVEWQDTVRGTAGAVERLLRRLSHRWASWDLYDHESRRMLRIVAK